MNIRHLKKIFISIFCLGIAVAFLLKHYQPVSQTPLLDIQSPAAVIEVERIKPETVKAEIIKKETSPTLITAPKEQAHTQETPHKPSEDERMAELIKQRLTPEMRAEINTRLNPPNQSYTEIKTETGGYVNLGKRAASVSIAFIDEEGNTVVTDITQPLANE